MVLYYLQHIQELCVIVLILFNLVHILVYL